MRYMTKFPEEDFQYRQLNSKTRAIVWQRTAEIKSLIRLTAENIIAIGQKLVEVKNQLEHGNFQTWLRSEFEWSEQTARQFMQVYRWSQTIENKNFVFSNLATSALYLLAAPSTSLQAKQKILYLVEAGEKITYSRAREIVDSYKESKAAASEMSKLDIIDVEVPDELQPKLYSSNRLFRLETSDTGSIVRLYRSSELESDSELTIGSLVTIKVGSLRGQTAKIAEVLTDLQTLEAEATSEVQSDILVQIDEIDDDSATFTRSARHLIISYGKVRLDIEADSQTLDRFIKQVQTNTAFVEKIFELANE